jgi:hypothetical protein
MEFLPGTGEIIRDFATGKKNKDAGIFTFERSK